MSRKVKPYIKHRHTKKTPLQFGGEGGTYNTYTIISKTEPELNNVKTFLTTKIPGSVSDPQMVTKVTVPKGKKTDFESKVKEKGPGYDLKQTGMCFMNCDYLLTTPNKDTLEDFKTFFPNYIIPPPIEYRTNVTISTTEQLNTLKYAAKTYNLIVNDANGKSLPSLSSSEFESLEKQYKVSEVPFDKIIEEGLKTQDVKEEPYDDVNFNKLYSTLVENNEKMKEKGEPLLIKPTELKDKMSLYNILLKIDSLVPPSNDTPSLLTKRAYVATFFITVADLKTNTKGVLTPAIFNNTSAAKFIKKLYEIEKPEGMLDAAGRLIPIISTLRDYYTGKHTVSFDSKAIGEEALRQQVKDVETGIENEFAVMSAFIGTKSQKVATKTALLAGMATGLWALVSKIQQNPETSAMLMAGIAAAGPQALVIGGIIAAVSVSYYVFLKVQDKYAKYFILIRTMNEYMIVLNKIDRLVRLSVRISERYHFDVNLKEIDAQLKVLFKRFDKMLSEDDVSTIEKQLSEQTTIPDFGVAAAEAEAKAEAAANAAMNEEGTKTDQGGGGGFMFRFTFDNEMWNRKLNDDVVKLNLYFTTAMTEFNMILNVIQMGFLTSDKSEDKVKLKTTNDLIKESTEYRKMVIGILLNDILKLRVDFSYCNRGGKLTNTKDEGVCLDPENMGVDAVGNRRSKFKEKLHGLMEHLVEVLNSKTCPYPPEIKNRIHKAVVDPYKKMINDATPVFGKENKFYLTESASLNQADIISAKKEAISKLEQKGGGFFSGKTVDTKPSPERDGEILNELKSRAYDYVTDDSLKLFLMGVDKFVKAENEPSLQEKEEAKQVANDMVDAAAKAAAEAKAKAEAKAEAEAKAAMNVAHDATNVVNPNNGNGGGRRLTQKRIFKLKKNHHRRVTRPQQHFRIK